RCSGSAPRSGRAASSATSPSSTSGRSCAGGGSVARSWKRRSPRLASGVPTGWRSPSTSRTSSRAVSTRALASPPTRRCTGVSWGLANDRDVEVGGAHAHHQREPERQVHLDAPGGTNPAEVDDRIRRPAELSEKARDGLLRAGVVAREEDVVAAL